MSTEDQPADTAAPSTADKVTPFEAKIAWDLMSDPNPSKLAAYFRDQGRLITEATVRRWQEQNFRFYTEEAFQDRVGDKMAECGLDVDLADDDRDRRLTEFIMVQNDAGLLKSYYRAIMAAGIKASYAVARNANKLAVEQPQSMGSAIQRTSYAINGVTLGMEKAKLLDQRAPAPDVEPKKEEEAVQVSGLLVDERSAWMREADKSLQ
jgi:hypothetical protein